MWHRDGALPIEAAISGDPLDQLRDAFTRCAEATRPDWLAAVKAGTLPAAFFDLPDPLAQDDLFIDLVDHPAYYGLLTAFSATQVTFLFGQFRTVPPAPLSYVGWHYDVERLTTPLHMKVQIYLDDTDADGGAFAYIPGSHKPDAGPYPLVRDPASMPGHRVYGGSAGTAILFNSYGMHTSMVNRSTRPRRSIILIYEVSSAATFAPDQYARFADRLNTPDRRQLFRIEPRP
ncbi:MAG: hypothetical protein HN712_18950 [Gemmatimonadetes bacterium]|nr:hypothetical protein [Gemmatimonadota bacterium]MBT6144975.1 hypothetical protein [Gemmatimonadota bacterium]MBT7862402.1 hypothetical protein [Gemmatimonadota bacterium]